MKRLTTILLGFGMILTVGMTGSPLSTSGSAAELTCASVTCAPGKTCVDTAGGPICVRAR